jgi:hypothetical protein
MRHSGHVAIHVHLVELWIKELALINATFTLSQ